MAERVLLGRRRWKQKLIYEYLDKFPNAHTTTLAKKAYAEHPALWPTFNACSLAFRRARGNQGKNSRQGTTNKSAYRENQVSGDAFGKLPDGLKQMPDIVAMQIDGPSCGLVISDLHIPYHDKTAVQCVLNESKRRELDWILLGGDMLDVYALSSWETDPRERDFKSEVRKMRVFLSILRDTWPEIPIIYKWGNHEERYVRYMECKAQELLDVDDFKLSKVLRCNTLDIQTVEERQIVKLGKLNFIHGHEYKFAIGNPVNPARGLFLRGKVNAFCGHFHQTSQHSENTMNDDWISCWSIGCLSDLHPRWMPLNKWNHGFAFIELDKVGAFSIENLRIIDGTVWR